MNKRKIYTIDIAILNEFDLSINEACAIINIGDDEFLFDDTNVEYTKLQDKKFIKIIKEDNKDKYLLRPKASDLIDKFQTIQVVAEKKNEIAVDIKEKIEEFRSKWKGLKPGSMGSLKSCYLKLARWMSENPEYSFEEVLQAADLYIESLGGDYRYLQRADYFIYKQENNREESSRLSSFIDEINISGGAQGDWTTQLN